MIWPFVEIIIITYNGEEFILPCLRSLKKVNYQKQKIKISILDNASNDKTRDIIKKHFPNLNLIQGSKNLGFAKANNILMKTSNAKYVGLLNQDSKVDKNWLKNLVCAMEQNPDIACCGAIEHPYNKQLRKDIALKGSTNLNNQIWMGGGSVLYRRKALEEVNFFDGNFFLYGEDLDLSWKLKSHGWGLVLNPDAIWHHHGWKREVGPNDIRTFYSLQHYIFILLKFGSMKQIIRSLNFFISAKNSKKCPDTPQNIKNKKDIRQQKFLLKIFLHLILIMPHLLKERFLIKLERKVSQKEIDIWIDYTNKQFFNFS